MPQSWPSNLPTAFLVDGLEYEPENNLSAFKPRIGEELTHPIATHVGSFQSGSMIMYKAQLISFDSFYRNTLQGGSLTFTFPDDVLEEEDQEWKFVGTPKYSPIAPDIFRVSMSLYRIPSAVT